MFGWMNNLVELGASWKTIKVIKFNWKTQIIFTRARESCVSGAASADAIPLKIGCRFFSFSSSSYSSDRYESPVLILILLFSWWEEWNYIDYRQIKILLVEWKKKLQLNSSSSAIIVVDFDGNFSFHVSMFNLVLWTLNLTLFRISHISRFHSIKIKFSNINKSLVDVSFRVSIFAAAAWLLSSIFLWFRWRVEIILWLNFAGEREQR